MAFFLSRGLKTQLKTQSRLTDDTFNPSNLQTIELPAGVALPADWLSFDEASADLFVDQMTEEAEKRSQSIRAAQSALEVLKIDTELVKMVKKVIEAAAKNEIAREEAFALHKQLIHKLDTLRAKAGMGLAVSVEQENIALAGYRRQLQEGLRRTTNLAKGGTHQGSLSLRSARNPFKIAG